MELLEKLKNFQLPAPSTSKYEWRVHENTVKIIFQTSHVTVDYKSGKSYTDDIDYFNGNEVDYMLASYDFDEDFFKSIIWPEAIKNVDTIDIRGGIGNRPRGNTDEIIINSDVIEDVEVKWKTDHVAVADVTVYQVRELGDLHWEYHLSVDEPEVWEKIEYEAHVSQN